MSSKIALITGGSRGLGKSAALKLAEKGIDIIITYHSQKEMADEVVREIEAMGRMAIALQFDSAEFKTLNDFVKQVAFTLQQKWNTNKFDFLINNAGIGATIPFEKVTEQDFDRFMNIHLKSVYFLCQQFLPMINTHGRIINMSTGTTRFTNPGYSVYASMKGAIEIFTRYLAKEVGPKGITANVIAPGPIETDFNNAIIRNSPPERRAGIIAGTALGRLGNADDIGSIIAMLCSDEAEWINGQRIEATGGINL
jgi:NAD(P)-dependent dehydrogenase (short-subunit alcohol dehydrogenase family)